MDPFEQLLARARASAVLLARGVDEAIREAFTEAIEQILSVEGAGHLDRKKAEALARRVYSVLEEFNGRAITITAQGVDRLVDRVVYEHRLYTERLLARYGVSKSPAWASVPDRAATMTAALRGAPDFRSLFKYRLEQRVLHALDGAIERAAVRGMSSRDFAAEIARTLVGDNKHLLTNLSKSAAAKLEAAGQVDSAKTIRGILYDSRRIAVSEINNHMRAANTASLLVGGIVAAATWTLSGRHDGLPSSPCECDDLATEDRYDYGPGVHLIERWPDAPHPFCACYQGGPVFYKDVKDWPESGPPTTQAEGPGPGPTINRR